MSNEQYNSDGDRVYPIYYVTVNWTQDGIGEKTGGLPKGRMCNGTGWYRIEKLKMASSEIEKEVREKWWPEYIVRNDAIRKLNPIENPDDLVVTVVLMFTESWCPRRFSHQTFDYEQTDSEALASFGRYVDRIEAMNRKLSYEQGTSTHSTPNNGLCLMGAEDRWRWCGTKDGKPNGERTGPPCRCEHCKKAGMVRINH